MMGYPVGLVRGQTVFLTVSIPGGAGVRFPLSCYGSVVFSDPPALPWSGEALFLVAGL